jgi:hypothetical protein
METPEEFLDALGNGLTRQTGTDVDLTAILKTHILTISPAQNAVAQAKDAILKLASKRANPPKPEDIDG